MLLLAPGAAVSGAAAASGHEPLAYAPGQDNITVTGTVMGDGEPVVGATVKIDGKDGGVILVTTKQGKKGRMQVTFDGYIGWQNPYKLPTLLDAQQVIMLDNENAFRWHNPDRDWHALLGDRVYGMVQDGWKGTDWVEASRQKNASTQNYAVGLAGGSDVSRFSAGFAYTKQDGIFGKPEASQYNRYTARLNSDHSVIRGHDFDILKIGENLGLLLLHAARHSAANGRLQRHTVAHQHHAAHAHV